MSRSVILSTIRTEGSDSSGGRYVRAAMGEADQQRRWLALILAPGLGPAAIERLGLAPEQADAALDASPRELQRAGLPDAVVRALRNPDSERLAASEQWLSHPRHCLVTRADALYPPLLRNIAGAPLALFVNGDAECLPRPQIAVVGSRNATRGGQAIAAEFAGALSRAGFVIASGLAQGIDASAHQAAIDAGGLTVAVAGTGPDQVYPARNRELALRIVDNGAVTSSFAPGVGPRAEHFPARNRIISGMSLGTLVVEASERSGSLITARLAGEQGREVFAVPGSIRNPLARGCHRLIRQGAKLVERPDEVVAELRPMLDELAGELRGLLASEDAGLEPDRDAKPDAQPPGHAVLLEAIGFDPVAVDELLERTGMNTQQVSALLVELELEGRVSHLGGGRYCRT